MGARYAVAAVTALATFAAPATAAAPACRLVVDPRDDARIGAAAPGRAATDILSADVASGARSFAAVIRVASMAPDDVMDLGWSYQLSWEIDSVPQYVGVQRYLDGEDIAWFDPNAADLRTTGQHPAKVTYDPKAGTVTLTVPRRANPELDRRGMRFENLRAEASASVNHKQPAGLPFSGTTHLPLGGDEASSRKTYTDRAASCVKGV